MPFAPGQSGNPGGQRRNKLFRDALLASLKKADGDVERIQKVAEALVMKAVGGDVQAIKEIADRIDGKVPQAIVGDESEAPIRMDMVLVRAVYPKTGGDDPGG